MRERDILLVEIINERIYKLVNGITQQEACRYSVRLANTSTDALKRNRKNIFIRFIAECPRKPLRS